MASIDTTDGVGRAATDAERISAFLLRHIGKDRIAPDEDIFAAGYVNSLFAVQLIAFIETTFAVRVGDEDLERANFRTVAAIEAFVGRKRAAAQQP